MGCGYDTRAIRAQTLGAKLLIVANSSQQTLEGFMRQDGRNAEELNIPTIMISEADGKKIMAYLNSLDPNLNQNVALSVTFPGVF